MSEVTRDPAGTYEESELAQYERLSNYEKTLQLFVEEAREMSFVSHEMQDTAYAASSELVVEWAEELRAADPYGNYPNLVLRGEGIYIPDVQVKRVESGFLVESNIEQPIRSLAVGESKNGSISGIYPVVTGREDGTFHADVQMAFSLDNPQNIVTVIPQLPQPIYSGQIESRGFALLSGDVYLESTEKGEFDRRLAVDSALAKGGILRSRLVRDINVLASQLSRAESHGYKELEDVDFLKNIARQCVAYAKQGTCSDVVLADKMMQVFKKGTPLRLIDAENGLVDSTGEIQGGQKGVVDEVFFRYDNQGQPKSLCIGLSSHDDNNVLVTSVYEIDRLIALHF